MSKNIEMEKRVMLTLEQYQALLEYAKDYPNRTELILVNHYFDDEALSLRNSHYMLRIRNINTNEYELTLKVKGDNGDLEINQPITLEEAKSLLEEFNINEGEIYNQLKNIDHNTIRLITSLKTERIEIPFDDFLFVLDKNYYSDVIDYDLEIESSSIKNAKKMIKKYCKMFGMQYSKHYLSKSRRAINKALNI